jgi:hypothetical protein
MPQSDWQVRTGVDPREPTIGVPFAAPVGCWVGTMKEDSMDVKRLAIETLVSAATLSGAGYIIFGVVLPDFYTNFLNAGSATGVARQPMLLWAIALGMLSYGLLIALAIEARAGSVTVRTGAMIGALVSFLTFFTGDFILYGISNVGNVPGILVDPFLEAVPGAVAGGLVAAVLGHFRERRSHTRQAA